MAQYNPPEGLKNKTIFPTDPVNEDAARGQIQSMFDQILDFHNAHLADNVNDVDGVHGLKIETGTFTPYIYGSTVSGSNTYTLQLGYYVKTGKMVHIDIMINLSVKAADISGNIRIGGLPFAGTSKSTYQANCSIGDLGYINFPTNYTILNGIIVTDTNCVQLYISTSLNNAPSPLNASALSNSTYVRLSADYQIN